MATDIDAAIAATKAKAKPMALAFAKAAKAKKGSEPLSFLEREFPNGGGVKLVEIGVADAYELLTAGRNPDNRSISQTKVTHYARDLEAGRWELTGDTIKISGEGLLNDGQHRLEAIIKAGKPMATLLVYGVSRESRFAVDQGKARGAGCYLGMKGIHYSSQIAAMARKAIAYEATHGRYIWTSAGPTNAEILAYVEANSKELEAAIGLSNKRDNATRLAPRSMWGLWYYLLRDKGPVAVEYIDKLETGLGIDDANNPAWRVRERLEAITSKSHQALTEAVFRGWIYYRDGRPMKAVPLRGELPKI